jgi:hypothetical protein
MGCGILSIKKGFNLLKKEFQNVFLIVVEPAPRVDKFKNLNWFLLLIAYDIVAKI